MNEVLKLKSISEVIQLKNFFIPAYQRGYRWEKQQIVDLLNDIYEFAINVKTKSEFYCLQPVVSTYKNGAYNLIDGQQRLTSIFIILKYLQASSERFKEIKLMPQYQELFEFCDIEEFTVPELYDISYETRQRQNANSMEFLKNIEENVKDIDKCKSNPDFFYMSHAYSVTKEWFKTKPNKLFLDILLKQVKVVWYEVECNIENENEEIKIFTRLNIGKIPLTNAELIKAMLLIPISDYKEQIEFSTIWDNIEQELQKDEFWYFLTATDKSDTAIDFIFKLLAQKYINEFDIIKQMNLKDSDEKYSYYVFDKVLKENLKTEKRIWDETRELFRYLVDWYKDREIYHKVGYLLNFDEKLLTLINLYEEKTKSFFKNRLDDLIKKKVKNVNLKNLEYGDRKIHEILLLFNIESILSNDVSNVKFQFDMFKKDKWDIEHIASQTDNINKEEWVKAVMTYIYQLNINKLDPQKLRIRRFTGKYFDRFFKRIRDKFDIKSLKDENKDNIGNLTLLDSKTNRSYGNAFFPIKRSIIIEQDAKARFIPIATKNIFLKQYSKKLSDMLNWNDDDIRGYRDAMYSLLEKYEVRNSETTE
ncbi:DUF262 domain-containing protein [Aliarcobacter cryaerophilus]|uniref:DUF262 domain-containing protein n=1 Tax=Aliarcobacter cryaerophilus TaxID=28198 RepID=UPI0021B69D35|nr:DUF262 domain-containing protein [Aliarcobacter cryaerophilus]MCT7519176.1 DUF262 domain-containing protein [Aliarcobacter cryaerophilus]